MSVGGNSPLQQLEAIYQQYGKRIYSLLLRLLVDEKAAESAMTDVFVRFSDELANPPDETQTLLRLRELAIETALRRLNGNRLTTVLHRFLTGLQVYAAIG